MRFLNEEEAKQIARCCVPHASEPFDPYSLVAGNSALQVVFSTEAAGRYFWLAERIVDSLEYFDWCLLWVTQTEVWAGSENLHLFYALRRSYGEASEIDQRPGQRFLRHEKADLVSFIHVGMLNGWDMVLTTSHDYGRVFVSHDGWAEVVRPNGLALDSLEKVFADANLTVRTLRPAS